MSNITVDEPLCSLLTGLEHPVELRDESGQPLGHFLPASLYRDLLYALAKAEVSDEELQERKHEPGGVSTAEALAHLESIIRSPRQAS
jgi:hypothetical protein